MEVSGMVTNVMLAAFATVGVIEVVKNFLTTEKKWMYSLIMIPLSLACYAAAEFLPTWVIGGILTIGVTQECYQIIIQSVTSIVKGMAQKLGGEKQNEQ